MNANILTNVMTDAKTICNQNLLYGDFGKTNGDFFDTMTTNSGVSKNYKKLHEKYNLKLPRGYSPKDNDNWCAMWISCLFLANGDSYFPTECSCEQMAKKFAKQDSLIDPQIFDHCVICQNISLGDIIFYDWDKNNAWADHVGIVVSMEKYEITISEGNRNNAVSLRKIDLHNEFITAIGKTKEYYKKIGKWS